jgi:serine/threonine protein kinase
VDARTDIWAIGVILHELLVGAVPFTGQNLPEICMKIATEGPPSIRAIRPDVPAGLDAVVARCLQKDRDRRYPNVAELAQALSEFGPGRGRASADRISRVIQHAGLSVSTTPLPPPSGLAGRSAATTMASGSASRPPASPIRSRVGLMGIAIDGLTVEASHAGDEITVTLRGNAEMTAASKVSACLDRLHAEAVRTGAERMTFDFRELYFMTSSCLKCFANLLAADAELEASQRYLIRFLANRNLHWQRRSLEALYCVSTELVRVESDA